MAHRLCSTDEPGFFADEPGLGGHRAGEATLPDSNEPFLNLSARLFAASFPTENGPLTHPTKPSRPSPVPAAPFRIQPRAAGAREAVAAGALRKPPAPTAPPRRQPVPPRPRLW